MCSPCWSLDLEKLCLLTIIFPACIKEILENSIQTIYCANCNSINLKKWQINCWNINRITKRSFNFLCYLFCYFCCYKIIIISIIITIEILCSCFKDYNNEHAFIDPFCHLPYNVQHCSYLYSKLQEILPHMARSDFTMFQTHLEVFCL